MIARRCLAVLAACILGTAVFAADEEREGGIIGTGITGIITKLGSIYVNDQHILLDRAPIVEDPLGPITAADLRPMDSVAVVAVLDGDDWHAKSVRRVYPIIGPVGAIGDGTLTVMGTEVEAADIPSDLKVGDWVAVSGLWRMRDVVASRVEVIAPQEFAQISGTAFGTDGALSVGMTDISGITPTHLNDGDYIRAVGVPVEGGLSATKLGFGLFASEPKIVFAQGYMSPVMPSGMYTLLGSGLVEYTDNIGMIQPAEVQYRCGAASDLWKSGEPMNDQIMPLAKKLGCD